MRNLYFGEKIIKDIESIVHIEPQEKAVKMIEKLFLKKKIYLALTFIIIIADLICNIKIKILLLMIMLLLLKGVFKMRNNLKEAFKDSLDKDIILYREISYEYLKHKKFQFKCETLIFSFIMSFMKEGKIREAFSILNKVNGHMKKTEKWDYYYNLISFFYYSEEKNEELLIKVFNNLSGNKLTEKNYFRNLLNPCVEILKETNIYEKCDLKFLEQKKVHKYNKIIYMLAVFLIIFSLLIYRGINNMNNIVNGGFDKFLNDSISDNVKEINIDQLEFYDSIEDSILCNEYKKNEKINKIAQIVKVIRKDDNCTVFFTAEDDDAEVLYKYDLKLKFDDSKILYSEPIGKSSAGLKVILDNMDRILREHNSSIVEELETSIRMDLKGCNFLNSIYKENTTDIIWGVAPDEKIKNLKINNICPTEIIELKVNNRRIYLWYYTELNINEDDIENNIYIEE